MSSMVWVVRVVTQEKCQNPCGSAGRSVGTWAPGGQAGPQGLGVNAKDCWTWQLCWGNTVIKWAESHAILCGWLRTKKEPELPPHQSTSNQMDSDRGSSKKDECPKPSGIHQHYINIFTGAFISWSILATTPADELAEALRRSGWALRFASERLKKDRSLVLEAPCGMRAPKCEASRLGGLPSPHWNSLRSFGGWNWVHLKIGWCYNAKIPKSAVRKIWSTSPGHPERGSGYSICCRGAASKMGSKAIWPPKDTANLT